MTDLLFAVASLAAFAARFPDLAPIRLPLRAPQLPKHHTIRPWPPTRSETPSTRWAGPAPTMSPSTRAARAASLPACRTSTRFRIPATCSFLRKSSLPARRCRLRHVARRKRAGSSVSFSQKGAHPTPAAGLQRDMHACLVDSACDADATPRGCPESRS